MEIRYGTRKWGGTDHDELRDPCQRRGPGSSTPGSFSIAEASRSHENIQPDLPPETLPEIPAIHLPREAFG